jgi:hypothetical protein
VESKRGRVSAHVKCWATTLAILAVLSASLALADDVKTISGKEYKNATINRVEPDGIVLKTKTGISKLYFVELPKEVQERFHFDPRSPVELMASAESALRNGQFDQSADLRNRIVSAYLTSSQARTVREVCLFLRDKQPTQNGPMTVSEAERLRKVMDALANIKKDYRTATPEKRRALETVLGAETFRGQRLGFAFIIGREASRVDGQARQGN